MKLVFDSRAFRLRWIALAAGAALMGGLVSCGGSNSEPPPTVAPLSMSTLSSRPDMVTGNDALVEVAFDKIGTKKLMLKAAGAHLTKL